MTIGVVVPTYNRRHNLSLCLAALARQTDQSFYLVVSDNGSSDGTEEAVAELQQTPLWRDRLIWVGFDSARDMHPSRARNRNKGVAALPQECTLICFVDSDVVLNEEALAHYARAHAHYPEAIIISAVDWLPPLQRDEIRELVEAGRLEALRQKVPPDVAKRVEGTYVGYDMRPRTYPELFTARLDAPLQKAVEKCFWTTNLACPMSVWQRLGGYDEEIVEYGPEDIEFGCQARAAGVACLYYTTTWGLHMWHPKANAARVDSTNLKNLGHIVQRHGLETFVPSLAKTKETVDGKLTTRSRKRLSEEQKMLLALRLRQQRQRGNEPGAQMEERDREGQSKT
jgi:GT2 family glycosyltransferase